MKKCNYCYTENSDDEKYSRKCGEKNGFHHIRLCVFVIIGDIFSFVLYFKSFLDRIVQFPFLN